MNFSVRNFKYNGVVGKLLPGIAPYLAQFRGWTLDPGVGRFDCSDGKRRLIPTFALVEERSSLPKQPPSAVIFGKPSHS
jgi:hypothetical protein